MDISNLPVTELTSGAILVWILQQLKKIPWVEVLPPWAFRIASIIWAIVSTLVVARLTVPQTAFPEHSHLVEGGIDVWFIASQFIIQEVVYRLTGTQAPAPEPQPAVATATGPTTPPATPPASGKKAKYAVDAEA